ncbi:MAG: sensor domain-containing protein [Saccharospirillum sp.]
MVYVNPALCNFTGYKSSELVGASPDIFQGPDTDPIALKKISEALELGNAVETQLLNYTQTGVTYHVDMKISPVTDESGKLTHFICVQRDISQQLVLERSLKQSNEQLRELTEKIPGAIYAFQRRPDGDYSFTFTSSGYTRLLRLPPSEPLSMETMFSVIKPEGVEYLSKCIEQSARTLTTLNCVYQLKPNDQGHEPYLKAYAQPYKLEDGTIKWFGLTTDITDRIAERHQIEYESRHDSLTGLLNRSGLQHALNKASSVEEQHVSFTAIFIDLDDFKVMNDVHGHDTGDALLIEVARRISTIAGSNSLVARIGGDEFLIVFVSGTNDKMPTEHAHLIAQSLRASITTAYECNGLQHHINCSIGIASSDDAFDIEKDLMVCADIALSSAKRNGGGSIRLFEHSMHAMTQHRHQLLQALTLALKEGGLGMKLAYQPITYQDELIGYEALLRWHHKSFGWVSPQEFIPIAEQSSLMIDLGNWVLDTAISKLQEWSDIPAYQHWVLSVNISALQLEQHDFVEAILDKLQCAGIVAHNLKLEVTETLAHYDLEGSIEKLKKLRATGIQCSLDDFGTGYSSLSHLQKMPLDEFKVDQKFVRDMVHDSGALAITRMIFSLAKTLDLRVVAEGVETRQELNMLKAMGYEYFQGYFFGKPVFNPENSKMAQAVKQCSR